MIKDYRSEVTETESKPSTEAGDAEKHAAEMHADEKLAEQERLAEKLAENHADELQKWPFGFAGRLLLKFGVAKNYSVAVLYSAFLFIVVSFLPLLFLCISDGTVLPPGTIKIPLLGDYVTLSRLLIAAPLLIVSDMLTRPWLIKAIDQFRANFIEQEDLERFDRLIDNVVKIRHSILADGIILVLAFITSPFNPAMLFTTEVPGWQIHATTGLTTAGWWNACVSQPLFRFVVFGWYFRYSMWIYFLFRVSRMKLRVIATHPDNAGGLSFISVTQTKFCLVAFALSSMICSVIAQTVVYHNEKLTSFTNLAIAFVIVTLLFFIGPLLVFSPILIGARQRAIFTYGSLCQELNELFASKWLHTVDRKTLIEAPDSSTVTDLNSQYTLIQNMRPAVFDRQFVMVYVIAICVPALPLVATVIPLKDLVVQIVKAIT